MKKDSNFQLSSYTSDLLKEKQAIFSSKPPPQPNFYASSSKKNITQYHNFQPVPIQNKSFQWDNRNQEKERVTQQTNLTVENPERVKSSSFQQKNIKGNSKFEYLAFVQKQYKEERERKGEEQKEKHRTTNKYNDSALIGEQLVVLKCKMERYLLEMQKKDELIVRKEKELVEKENKIVELEERVVEVEKECSNYHTNYSFLHEQYLQSQKEKEYYAKMKEKQSGIAEQCQQLQTILQQKDIYIQNIIAAKNNEYNSLVNSRNQEVKTLQTRISIIQHDNNKLLTDIRGLTNQLTQMQASPQLQHQHSSTQISKFEQLGHQFQTKLEFYSKEQHLLKNIISNCQGEIQQLRVQKQSLEGTIKAYEERDSIQRDSVLQQEIIRLRLALDSEKQEIDRVVSRQELEILKLQNSLASKHITSHSSLIDIFDQQRLRQSLYLALEQLNRMRVKC